MKILVVANGYPTPRDPQWGCFERDQAIALKALGHDVAMIAVDTRFRRYRRKRGISIIQTEGFPVYWGYWFPAGLLKLLCRSLKDWVVKRQYDKVYSRIVRDWGTPDIMYAHYQRNIFYSSYLKNKYGVPLVGMEHWSALMQNPLPASVEEWGRKSYPCLDKMLVVSDALAEKIKSVFGIDAGVVHDMLGPEFLDYTYQARRNGGCRFIAVGSLLPIKGYDILVKAFAASGLSAQGCSVSIIGDGPERQTLEVLIENSGVKGSVALLGRKGKNEIVKELRDSDVFVLSSHSETFGVACIEAMSQGLPCIATLCGGPEEFVSEKDGMLIPRDDQNALEKALCHMQENYSRFDREDISARCLDRFSPQGIAKQLTQLFEEVANKRG